MSHVPVNFDITTPPRSIRKTIGMGSCKLIPSLHYQMSIMFLFSNLIFYILVASLSILIAEWIFNPLIVFYMTSQWQWRLVKTMSETDFTISTQLLPLLVLQTILLYLILPRHPSMAHLHALAPMLSINSNKLSKVCNIYLLAKQTKLSFPTSIS